MHNTVDQVGRYFLESPCNLLGPISNFRDDVSEQKSIFVSFQY